MPGVLFHHETPLKDYFYDKIKPWVHYVPIREDLMDLKERYDWAESHPNEARKISERATEFVKGWGSKEGFELKFKEFYEEPLRKVVNAYQPLPEGTSWREGIQQYRSDSLSPMTMMRCGGNGNRDCEELKE